MQALAGFCLALFVLTVTVVGARMLWLARRTHGRPELLMGAGMVLVGTIGSPLGAVSGFGGPVGAMNLPLWAVGMLSTQIGLALIYTFTWQVFRPSETWARALVALGACVMAASLVASLVALAGAPDDAPSQAVVRGPVFLGMAGYSGCFLWTAIEGFVQHRNARRRMALGLGDPVVADRFLLWGVFGLMATGINVASLAGNALGVDPSRSPLVLVPMGVLGCVASVAMSLAFLPPAAYLAFVRRRARAHS